MALTRKLLKSLNLDDSVIDTIIDAHAETVDALKQQRDDAVQASQQAEALTKERDDLKTQLETLQKSSGDAAKVQAAFDAYKAEAEKKETTAKKRAAMDALLRDKVGIQRDSARRLILGAESLEAYELAEDGGYRDADKIAGDLKTKYADFVTTQQPEGLPKTDPPTGGSGGKDKDPFEKGFDL